MSNRRIALLKAVFVFQFVSACLFLILVMLGYNQKFTSYKAGLHTTQVIRGYEQSGIDLSGKTLLLDSNEIEVTTRLSLPIYQMYRAYGQFSLVAGIACIGFSILSFLIVSKPTKVIEPDRDWKFSSDP